MESGQVYNRAIVEDKGILQMVKFLLIALPIEMAVDSIVYGLVGLANTAISAVTREGLYFIRGAGFENEDNEGSYNFTSENLKQEFEKFSVKEFIEEHIDELKTGAFVDLAFKNICPTVYEELTSFEDKMKFINIDIPQDSMAHGFHLVYDLSHKGAHLKHSLIDPPYCIFYENKPVKECVSNVIQESLEHVFFVFKYAKIVHDTFALIYKTGEDFIESYKIIHDEL